MRFFVEFLKPLPLLVAVFFYAGCSNMVPVSVQSKPFSSIDNLSRYRTYAISGPVRTGSRDPLFTIPGLDVRIRLDIENGMTMIGLSNVNGPADIKIYYYFGLQTEDELFPLPYRVGAASESFLTADHTSFRLGSRFTIDLVDANRNELVWSGSDTTFHVRNASDPERVSSSIFSILKKFPQ